MILLHENAHLRRWDQWTNLAQKIVTALFFFHPAVWWIENRLTLEREMACDDIVLAQTASPRDYASFLISFAEKIAKRPGSCAGASPGEPDAPDVSARSADSRCKAAQPHRVLEAGSGRERGPACSSSLALLPTCRGSWRSRINRARVNRSRFKLEKKKVPPAVAAATRALESHIGATQLREG